MEERWFETLKTEFEQPYMQALRDFLRQEKDLKKVIYPKSADVFNAFNLTSFDDVKVVLLGQDPYHGPGQAQGLCFSVPENIPLPPSLINIYKELKSDLGIAPANTGNLSAWAKEGVLLLNSVLTVEQSKPSSHQGKGWEQFTDRVIALLNEQKNGLVFLLWGSYAKKKGQFIDTTRHLVLTAAHPSPFSAHQGFLGCRHFSKANQYLVSQGKKPIDWRVNKSL